MKFEEVCQTLNAYFTKKNFLNVLLPLSVPIMLACAILQFVARFISLGSIVNAVTYFGFYFALLMVLSLCNFKMAAIGLAIYALDYVYSLVYNLIRYQYVSASTIIYILVYGFFAYEAYKKTLPSGKGDAK